ncbi:MAG: sugar kinase [Pirellulales bacterium]|nr:sugar kinase [Pirellulales bacterium]
MTLVVVGSIALDTVETPTACRENVLGGSAVYFSYAASFFAPVHVVGAVGEDWQADFSRMLSERNVDLSGVRQIPGGKTFRWRGKYHANMNDRETLEVHLNVLEQFDPVLPDSYRGCQWLFLGNASPAVQLRVLEQVRAPRLVVADTMDLWINIQHDELRELLRRIDGLVLNDSEARLLADDDNLVRAGRAVQAMGPRFVVIKKGEHGAMLFGERETYVLPAYPTAEVVDPTGAGDSFAGGLLGWLAMQGELTAATWKQALACGVVVASFVVEDFSLDRLRGLTRADIDRRLDEYRRMVTY